MPNLKGRMLIVFFNFPEKNLFLAEETLLRSLPGLFSELSAHLREIWRTQSLFSITGDEQIRLTERFQGPIKNSVPFPPSIYSTVR
jgi:hypothetical protein